MKATGVIACFMLASIAFAGCATVTAVPAGPANAAPKVTATPVPFIEEGAVVVKAKRLTRLEKLRAEAARKNNGSTVEVIAGTVAAVAAYSAAELYGRANYGSSNALVSFGVTVAAAYAAAGISGWIYNLLTQK